MEIINLVVQLYKVSTDKDGGGKITFEFGSESLDAIHEIQMLNGQGKTNLAIAIVPFVEDK